MSAADPEAREAMRAQIVEALGEHADWFYGDDERATPTCDCGFVLETADGYGETETAHRAHLADVLLGLWDGDES